MGGVYMRGGFMTELDRIDAEIRAAEQALRSGKPHEDALVVWWSDWLAERRLVETETKKQQ
jgi:hypothetical protein